MLEDPRALPIFFITFYSMILISTRLFKIKIRYFKITIFSIVLSLFDYLAKYLAIKLGYALIWHISLSLVLLVLLIYKINQTNFFNAMTVGLTSYILLFLSETVTEKPCLFLVKYVTGLSENTILSNQKWYSIWGLLLHLPLYFWALLYIFKNQPEKGRPDPWTENN